MEESKGFLPLKSQQPGIQLLVSLITMFAISLLLMLIIFGLGRLIFGYGLDAIDLAGELSKHDRIYLISFQAMSQISIFMVPAVTISWMFTGDIYSWQGLNIGLSPTTLVLLLILAFSIIPIITVTGVFNSNLALPSGLENLENWMRVKEDKAMKLTGQLVQASTVWSLIINIVVLAIIPAISEELLFRGIIQQILQKWFNSGILAVVVTAILFSSLHFQFYGFLPRFILGIIFGLLFLWSRSIWIPIIAHLLNNIVPVILSYKIGWSGMNETIGNSFQGDIVSLIVIIVLPVVVLIVIRDQIRSIRS
jgi:hypothetical protein